MTDKMREEFEKWHMERYGGFGLGRSTEPGYTDEYERVGTNLQWEAWQAARTVPEGYVVVPDAEKLTDIIANGLRGTYHCTRVWSAWGIGTMSEDDFSPVEESDIPADIAESLISMLSAAPEGKK